MKIVQHTSQLSTNGSEYFKNAFNPIAMLSVGNGQLLDYYPIDVSKSDYDQGFVDKGEAIGIGSHLRYKMIKNVLGMGFPDLMFESSFLDDMGTTEEHSGNFTLFVDTARPTPGDLFQIKVINRPYIFEVTSVKGSTVMNEPVYEISYKLLHNDQDKLDQLQKQVTDKFIMVLEKYGTNDSYVMKEEAFYSNKKYIEELVELAKMYETVFFNRQYSSFEFPDPNAEEDLYLIDWFIHQFLFQNQLVVMDKMSYYMNTHYNTMYEPVFIESPPIEPYEYQASFLIRYLTKELDKELYLYPNVSKLPSQFKKNVGTNKDIITRYQKTNAESNENYVPYSQQFCNDIIANTELTEVDDDHEIRNIIIKYYHGQATLSDFDSLEISAERTKFNYYYIPLLIYIYRDILGSNE